MGIPDFKCIFLSAKLAQAVYETDITILANAVEALGLEYRGLFENDECQALVSHEGEIQHVTIRGTQVEEHTSFSELWDDLNMAKTGYGGGATVCSGIIAPLRSLWFDHLAGVINLSKPIVIEGHSLGGNRATVAPVLLPQGVNPTVIALAPPQGANKPFWDAIYKGRTSPAIIGNEGDFAPGWNHLDPSTCQAGPIIRLKDSGGWDIVNEWSIWNESIPDHDIDLYVSRLEKIVEVQK